MERKRFSNPFYKDDPVYLLPKTPCRPAVLERNGHTSFRSMLLNVELPDHDASKG